MTFFKRTFFSCIALGAMTLAGCHSSAVQRAVSPLMGTWQINGSVPEPDANLPRFTQLSFRRDGTLDASYVAAGGALASVVKSSSQVRSEHDSYTLVGKRHVRIIEGSRSLNYHYEIRDDKLFLTGPGSDTAMVFAKIHPKDDEQSDQDSDAPEATPTPNDSAE
jgi:hypothetical protein